MQQPSRIQPKRRGATLTEERILNSTSPIADSRTDLTVFFCSCISNWDTFYSEEEKEAIIATLPPQYQKYERDEQGRLLCPLTAEFVASDYVFRDSIAKFQRDVADGYWTATWRKNAMKASKERAEGKFDEFLASRAEEAFGGTGENSWNHGDEPATSDGEYDSKLHRSKGKSQGKSKGKSAEKRKGRDKKLSAQYQDDFE